MITNIQQSTTEVQPVGALLWVADHTAASPAAPDWLGGQTLEGQMQAVIRKVTEEKPSGGDGLLVINEMPDWQSPAKRLGFMVRMLTETPIERLYVPASLYAGDTESTIREHVRVLSLRETDLVLCDDE